MAAKVHPQVLPSSASCYFTSKQETFTIWMKSLVLGCKGCTVFDAKGQIVYRVDIYSCKYRDEVYLMDFKGKVLFTILRKVKKQLIKQHHFEKFGLHLCSQSVPFLVQRFKLFRFWEGYRSTTTEVGSKKPGFQVSQTLRISRGDSPCEVIVGLDENQPRHYKIQSWDSSKSACKIADQFGGLVAEVNLVYTFSSPHCDFADQKYDFKPNHKKIIVRDCILKKL